METTSPPLSESAPAPHLELGRRGEELAAAYLQKLGYRIVAANFSLPVGRNRAGALINVEIDLVAYEGETLCFVEVKSRASDWFAPPEANIDRRKRRQVARAARAYRRMFDLSAAPYRYDVVTVLLPAADEGAANWDVQVLRSYWTRISCGNTFGQEPITTNKLRPRVVASPPPWPRDFRTVHATAD